MHVRDISFVDTLTLEADVARGRPKLGQFQGETFPEIENLYQDVTCNRSI